MKRLILKVWMLVMFGIVGTALSAQAPVITNISPSNLETDVALDQTLIVTFDQDIQFSDGPTTIRIKLGSNDNNFQNFAVWESDGFTSSSLSISGNQLTINHNLFSEGTEYYVIIPNDAIESLTAIPFDGILTSSDWKFTTVISGPEVSTLNPDNGLMDVALDQSLTVTFDQDIQFSDGPTSIRIKLGSNNADFQGYVVWETEDLTSSLLSISGNQLIINHNLFSEGTEYYVIIPSDAIESLTGVPFDGILTSSDWRFTTVISGPEVSTLNPDNGSTDVALDQSLTVTFDQDIQFSDGPTTIQIKLGSNSNNFQSFVVWESDGFTSSSLSISGNQLTINHNLFSEGTEYYVIIPDDAIESLTAIPFDGILTSSDWRFTTVISGPEVSTLNPDNGLTDVALDQALTVTFDQDIQFSDGPTSIRIKLGSNNADFQGFVVWETEDITSSLLSISGNQLTINHNLFSEGIEYYVIIPNNAIESTTGVPFDGILTSSDWRFTAVIPAPEVTDYNPLQGAIGIDFTQSLELTFDQDIQFGDGPQVIRIRRSSDDVIFQSYSVDGTGTDTDLSILGSILTINHLPFGAETTYYVTISNGAIESLTGTPFAGFATNSDWSFTTIAQSIGVTGFNPNNEAIDVSIDQVLTITFDQDIQFGAALNVVRIKRIADASIFQSFTVEGLDTDTELTISGTILSIQHNPFVTGVGYYVTIGDGAIESITGNAFVGFDDASVWSFTTLGSGVPPYIITDGLSPVPASIGVLVSESMVITFNEDIQEGAGYMTIYDSDGNDFTSISANSSKITINGSEVTITHPLFDFGTDYYVLIPSGFFKSLSNVDFPGITMSTEWYFQTELSPPAWVGEPYTSDQNLTALSLNGEVDTDGFFYFVITESVTSPTADQIEAGLDQAGLSALGSGTGTVVANVLFSYTGIDISGLTAGSDYYLHVVAKSGSIFTERKILVIDRSAPTILDSSTPEDEDDFVSADIQIVLNFNEKLYRGGVEITNDNINTLGILYLRNGVTSVSITGTISTDGTSIIITPDLPLNENSDYEIEVYRLEDLFGNIQVSRTIRTFQTDKENYWIGNGNPNDWNDIDNWLDGNLVSGKSVIVPADATVFPVVDNETIDVNDLIIEAGALLTQTGGTINITGIFNLQSSSTVNASFIKTGGTLNVEDANVQINQVVSDSGVTYFFSSPVSGSTPNSIGTTEVVYQFNNSTGLYSVVNGSSSLAFGRGYATRSTQPLVFSGTVNQGNLDYPVYRSTAGFGWNLVGNPYPASIDWTLFKDSNTNLEDAFWVWNQDGGNYGVYNAGIVTNGLSGPIIPSNQAFLVKVLLEQTVGNVAFNTGSLVQNTQSYLKSSSTIIPHIKLAGVNGAFRDEVAFAVTSSASSGIDRLDTEKYFSKTSDLFELYSQVGSMSTVISSYPSEDLIEIPLGFKAKLAGSYTIEMAKNNLPDYKVVLIDVSEDVHLDVTDGGSYDFTVTNEGNNITRFKVELIKQTTTSNKDLEFEYEQVDIYVNDGTLFVKVASGNSVSDYQILDLNGRILRRGLLLDSELNRIEGLQKGIYIISIMNENKSVSNHKFVVL